MIAYVIQDRPDHSTLQTIRADGRERRTIASSDGGFIRSLVWSPEGDAIAYEEVPVTISQGGSFRIWLIRADGTQQALLYGRGLEAGSYPSWAPDGSHLAFYEPVFRVVGVFGFTRTLRTVTDTVPSQVSWAPDSHAITFVTRGDNPNTFDAVNVADVHADPAVVHQITDGIATDGAPSWAPSGEWIAFSRLQQGGQSGIWLIHPDGSDAHALFQEAGWIYNRPFWSPQGDAIAFSRVPVFGRPPAQGAEIWIAPLVGAAHRLNAGGDVAAWIP
jgi:Tol biopolymer transport system component